MERLFYQRQWQGIPLKPLHVPDDRGVAGREFYAAFYRHLLSNGGDLPPEWLARKRRVGEWLIAHFLQCRGSERTLRLLSVGGGLGVVEKVLLERGYPIHVLECEERCLRYLRSHCPDIPCLIGDARQIPIALGRYDLIYLSTVDYCFNRREYEQVLTEVGRVMRASGRAVSICTSNLSLREMTLQMARALLRLGPAGSGGHPNGVPWGYQRSVGEHLRAGWKAGLACESVVLFDEEMNLRTVRAPGTLGLGWPTWGEAVVAVVFKRRGE